MQNQTPLRWRFVGPENEQDAARRRLVESQIDAWWIEFRSKVDELRAHFSRKLDWDLPGWMKTHLQAIDERLSWEFGPAVRENGHRLVITPESYHHLRPLVREILNRAPVIEGWEFYEYRLPESVRQTHLALEGRTGHDISDFEVHASIGQYNRIDLEYLVPNLNPPELPPAINAAFITTEELLGEECLNTWIGGIDVKERPPKSLMSSLFSRGKPRRRYLPLERLKETVVALIESMKEQLPPTPYFHWVDEATWTLWDLKLQSAEDYPEQNDLFVATSCSQPLWTAIHHSQLFSSEQFSRFGETFCTVKLDGSGGNDDEKFDKSEIQDALDSLLKSDGLGCHIGGGTGLKYSYVDLALLDLPKGIKVVRNRLQEGNVPKRSWILFFDDSLKAEWIGIYDDTPPPPSAPIDE